VVLSGIGQASCLPFTTSCQPGNKMLTEDRGNHETSKRMSEIKQEI